MVQRQPVGICRQTIMDNIVMLTSMHVCVCTVPNPLITRCLVEKVYIIAPHPIRCPLM